MASPHEPGPTHHRSLAESAPGDFVEVVYVLFESLRQHCDAAGIRPGTRMRLRGRKGKRVVLEMPGGSLAELNAVHAPFVEVRPVPGDPLQGAAPPSGRPAAVRRPVNLAASGDSTSNPRIA